MRLSNYEFIQTEDGSMTAYSHLYGEACHSTFGAKSETKLHYIQGCEIEKKALSLKASLKIFEVGFGVGVGFFESYKALQGKFFEFFSVEIDEDLVKYVTSHNSLLKEIKRKEEEEGVIFYHLKNNAFDLKILIGDARLALPHYLKNHTLKVHAIYQDAFSPKRNPDLWTVEWFKLLKDISQPDVIMSTYSSSSAIRKSMLQAGFKLYAGEKFGPKRSSTRARLTGETDPDILLHLERSNAIILTDANKDNYKLEK